MFATIMEHNLNQFYDTCGDNNRNSLDKKKRDTEDELLITSEKWNLRRSTSPEIFYCKKPNAILVYATKLTSNIAGTT